MINFLKSDMQINVEIEVKSKEDKTTQENAVKQLTKMLNGIKSDNSPAAQQLKKIQLPGDQLVLERVETVGSITGVCADGQIYETYVKSVNPDKTERTETTCGNYTIKIFYSS